MMATLRIKIVSRMTRLSRRMLLSLPKKNCMKSVIAFSTLRKQYLHYSHLPLVEMTLKNFCCAGLWRSRLTEI